MSQPLKWILVIAYFYVGTLLYQNVGHVTLDVLGAPFVLSAVAVLIFGCYWLITALLCKLGVVSKHSARFVIHPDNFEGEEYLAGIHWFIVACYVITFFAIAYSPFKGGRVGPADDIMAALGGLLLATLFALPALVRVTRCFNGGYAFIKHLKERG